MNCGPWVVDIFSIFCEFDESIPIGTYNIDFENVKFEYSNVEINLYSSVSIEIIKEDYNMVDIYSEIQTINLSDDKEEYELKFNIYSYNNEQLFFIFGENIVQANCNQKNNLLICPLKKDTIKNQLGAWINTFLTYVDGNGDFLLPYFGQNVVFNYNGDKTDIFISFKKLLTRNNIGKKGIIIYETNVTDVPIMDISFGNSFYLFQSEERSSCRFVKGGKNPMLYICQLYNVEYAPNKVLSLKDIEKEGQLPHLIYNFRIQPTKMKGSFTINEYNDIFIYKIYPELLDFTLKDSYKIDIITKDLDDLPGMTFNEEKPDLECENKGMIKRCLVTKEHFEGLKSDYYYIMRDFLNIKEIVYETIPIQVILS